MECSSSPYSASRHPSNYYYNNNHNPRYSGRTSNEKSAPERTIDCPNNPADITKSDFLIMSPTNEERPELTTTEFIVNHHRKSSNNNNMNLGADTEACHAMSFTGLSGTTSMITAGDLGHPSQFMWPASLGRNHPEPGHHPPPRTHSIIRGHTASASYNDRTPANPQFMGYTIAGTGGDLAKGASADFVGKSKRNHSSGRHDVIDGFSVQPQGLPNFQLETNLKYSDHLPLARVFSHNPDDYTDSDTASRMYRNPYSNMAPPGPQGVDGEFTEQLKHGFALLQRELSETRQQLRDREIRLKLADMNPSGGGGVPVFEANQLREYQNEIASLKTQLVEENTARNIQLEKVNRNLGVTECEMDNLKANFSRTTQCKNESIESLESKLKSSERNVSDLEKKLKVYTMENKCLHDKLANIERYVEDLPTAQEHQKMTVELTSCNEKKNLLKIRIAELSKKMVSMRSLVSNKDSVIEDLKQKLTDASLKEMGSTKEIELLRSRFNGDEQPPTYKEIESLKIENERSRLELGKLKKIIDSQRQKQRSIQSEHESERYGIEERLAQEEDTTTAYREAAKLKDQQIEKLRTSIKKLAAENQDLLEKNMMMEDRIKVLEGYEIKEKFDMMSRLFYAISSSYSELQGIVQLFTDKLESDNVNMSELLSNKTFSYSPINLETEPNLVILTSKLGEVEVFHEQIQELKSVVIDRYAEDIGNNCIMQ